MSAGDLPPTGDDVAGRPGAYRRLAGLFFGLGGRGRFGRFVALAPPGPPEDAEDDLRALAGAGLVRAKRRLLSLPPFARDVVISPQGREAALGRWEDLLGVEDGEARVRFVGEDPRRVRALNLLSWGRLDAGHVRVLLELGPREMETVIADLVPAGLLDVVGRSYEDDAGGASIGTVCLTGEGYVVAAEASRRYLPVGGWVVGQEGSPASGGERGTV